MDMKDPDEKYKRDSARFLDTTTTTCISTTPVKYRLDSVSTVQARTCAPKTGIVRTGRIIQGPRDIDLDSDLRGFTSKVSMGAKPVEIKHNPKSLNICAWL